MHAIAKKQSGMTFIGWLIVLGLIAFFTLITLKVGPIYLADYKVPKYIRFLGEALPRNPGGKVKKEVLRAMDREIS